MRQKISIRTPPHRRSGSRPRERPSGNRISRSTCAVPSSTANVAGGESKLIRTVVFSTGDNTSSPAATAYRNCAAARSSQYATPCSRVTCVAKLPSPSTARSSSDSALFGVSRITLPSSNSTSASPSWPVANLHTCKQRQDSSAPPRSPQRLARSPTPNPAHTSAEPHASFHQRARPEPQTPQREKARQQRPAATHPETFPPIATHCVGPP